MFKKGFTLIELLIVIAILAIIAVGLIASLDPLEQTRRATDASKRQLGTDILSAFDRFYAQRQYQAFCATAACAATVDGVPLGNANNGVAVSALGTTSNNLNTYGESKSTTVFTAHPQAAKVFVSYQGAFPNISATVCWQPDSKSQKGDATSIYSNNTGTGAACVPGVAATCYQCVKQ
jgi:prepilin-type N-terminal cleavage/methylation domain-containing protein